MLAVYRHVLYYNSQRMLAMCGVAYVDFYNDRPVNAINFWNISVVFSVDFCDQHRADVVTTTAKRDVVALVY